MVHTWHAAGEETHTPVREALPASSGGNGKVGLILCGWSSLFDDYHPPIITANCRFDNMVSDLPKVETDDEQVVVVRVRSREGDEVTWTQQASCLAGTLRNWMSTTDDETPFPTEIPAPALCMLKAVCTHARSTPAPVLSSCSLDELMAVMSAANFLEADDAFSAGARQVHHRQPAAQTSSNQLKPRPGGYAECIARVHSRSYSRPTPWQLNARFLAGKSVEELRSVLGAQPCQEQGKACTAGQRRPSGVARGWPGPGAA